VLNDALLPRRAPAARASSSFDCGTAPRRPRSPIVWPTRPCGIGIATRAEKVMGIFSKPIKSVDDLFVHTLQDIYYAENQITKALPKMIDKATDPDLRRGFEQHLQETRGQIERLERVFAQHGQPVKGVTCRAMDGIIAEAEEIIGEVGDKATLDAAMLASAQSVEHYEIARYGALVAYAKQLGCEDCASLLQQNLEEEKATDQKLTRLAESRINAKAA
jgi:ferritin-like metal-binding protein YciE